MFLYSEFVLPFVDETRVKKTGIFPYRINVMRRVCCGRSLSVSVCPSVTVIGAWHLSKLLTFVHVQ